MSTSLDVNFLNRNNFFKSVATQCACVCVCLYVFVCVCVFCVCVCVCVWKLKESDYAEHVYNQEKKLYKYSESLKKSRFDSRLCRVFFVI